MLVAASTAVMLSEPRLATKMVDHERAAADADAGTETVMLLEITEPRGPCSALDIYGPTIKEELYDRRVKARDHTSPHWGMSGFYLSVVEPGPVCPGDIIAVVAQLA